MVRSSHISIWMYWSVLFLMSHSVILNQHPTSAGKSLLSNFTNFSISVSQQEEVRPQDTVSVIGGVAGSSKQGRKAAWKFVRDNWEELYNRYQGGFLISRLIKVKNKNLLRPGVTWPSILNSVTLKNLAGDLFFECDICFRLSLQLTVDGFAIDKMAAEVKVSAPQNCLKTTF